MATIEQRLQLLIEKEEAAKQKAAELSVKKIELKKKLAAKKQLQENREFESEKNKWGRRPKETHQKVLCGVAVLSFLRKIEGEEKEKLKNSLLSQLENKDRIALLEMPEFN